MMECVVIGVVLPQMNMRHNLFIIKCIPYYFLRDCNLHKFLKTVTTTLSLTDH